MRRLIFIVMLSCLLTTPALAQTTGGDVSWQRYDVALDLQPDGSLRVTETQAIRFQGTFRHGYRVVPPDRSTGIGQVSVAEVRGGQEVAFSAGAERPNEFATSRVSDGLAIDWWFEPTRGTETRTFVVRYTAQGATRIYADTAQVQWKAIYAERGGPVEVGAVTLRLPATVPETDLITAAYEFSASGGRPREVGGAQLVGGNAANFGVGKLPTDTGYEVRAQVPRALVSQATLPPWQADADRADWIEQSLAPILTFLALLLALAIAVGGGVLLFVMWYGGGREPDVGPVPDKLAEPPSKLPAPLAGTLVDGVADLQDAVATLVDLAQRGVISLKHEGGDVRVSLHGPTDDPSLRPYERVLLAALFGTGASSGEMMLSAARGRFAAAVPVLEERLYQAIADEGLFVANPETTRKRYVRYGVALVVGGLALAVVSAALLAWAAPSVWLPGAALAVVGLVLIWLARAMPRRTPRGALEARRWQAFRTHLLADEEDAEAAAYLPYAVAFGIDRDYLHRLEPVAAPTGGYMRRRGGGIVFVPGGWYGGGFGSRTGPGADGRSGPAGAGVGGGGEASPQGWSDALADLLNSASDAMAQGGGSGRWSGGGFGGGGGGGGGRGGFN